MIRIKNVAKSFGDLQVFKNVNLDINDGDAVVIIGGSGCGKSTLLRAINKLAPPDEGEIWIDGKNILAPDADVNGIRKKMGMVYQSFNLFSHLNVMENIILAPMKVLGMSQEEAIKEAEEYLTMVGLYDWRYHMPSQLSGGQKQRVAIARTLAMHPEVILFDEPTSALDPTMVDEVENVIRKLVDSGLTSVIVTHEMRFARNIASKVVFLAEKGIYETGTAEEVFGAPKKPLTRQFIYRSRMTKATVDKNTDCADILSGFKKFISNYDYDKSQFELLHVAFDECVLPIVNSGIPGFSEANISLVCSETSRSHMLFITLGKNAPDPFEQGPLDELNKKLLESRFALCYSVLNTSGDREIILQM